MAKTLVGLEITEESVRAVEVSAGRTPTLLARGEIALPPGAAKDSEVLDLDAVAVALRQLWTRAGIKGRKVVLGIGSRRILVREYTTTAMRPDLLRQALPFQVQDLLPVPVDQAVLDFYPVSQQDDQVTGLLVAAVSETVEGMIAAIAKAKLTVERVDLVPFGLARIAHTLAPDGGAVGMIHVGDHTSYVVVAANGVPRFLRIIPVDVATAAARAHQAEAPATTETEDAPSGHGASAMPLRSRFGRSDGLDSAISDLTSRLGATVAFYRDRVDATPSTAVYFSGAGIAVPGVVEALEPAIAVTPTVLTLPSFIKCAEPFESQGDADLNFVTTIGILLGGKS